MAARRERERHSQRERERVGDSPASKKNTKHGSDRQPEAVRVRFACALAVIVTRRRRQTQRQRNTARERDRGSLSSSNARIRMTPLRRRFWSFCVRVRPKFRSCRSPILAQSACLPPCTKNGTPNGTRRFRLCASGRQNYNITAQQRADICTGGGNAKIRDMQRLILANFQLNLLRLA